MALKKPLECRMVKPIRMLLPPINDIKQMAKEERKSTLECVGVKGQANAARD